MAGKGRPKGKGAKATNAMSALRLQQVEDALLAGRSTGWCIEYFGEAWSIEARQVQNYVARVQAKWRERSASPERREEARERCLMLLRDAQDANKAGVPGALGAAVKAADLINKIDGVYSPVEVRHSGAIEVSKRPTAERRARLAELEAKRQQALRGPGAH